MKTPVKTPVSDMSRMRRYRTDIVAFIDDCILRTEEGQPFRLADHQRKILRLAFRFSPDGKLAYVTIVYSAPKKSGKTCINAIVVLWWAITQEAPNEILILANDAEQAQGRVFKAVRELIAKNPALKAAVLSMTTREIRFKNGTTITALPQDYTGAAGSKHGLTSWDELWGFNLERATRLWEELTPVATRKNSIRFITTYAGFENESELLWNLYLQGVGPDEHPDGQGVRLDPDLPVYANARARLFCYWDHEARMPWQQSPEYYEAERETLRPATYQRLHENRWGASETSFITEAMWRDCVDPLASPLLAARDRRRDVELFVGVDVATKHDSSAVVAVRRVEDKLTLARHRIWRPSPDDPLDIERTVEAYLRELHRDYRVKEILVDPFQMARSIQTLKAAGLPIREFPQTVEHCTQMGSGLYELFKDKNLRLYAADDLRAHVLNAVVVESSRGWRLAKEKASKKIDGAVALSMACVAALTRPVGGGFSSLMVVRTSTTGEQTIFVHDFTPKTPVNPMALPVAGYSERGDMPKAPEGMAYNRQGRLERAPWLHPHGDSLEMTLGIQCLACGATWETVTEPIALEHGFIAHWGLPHPKHKHPMPPLGQRYRLCGQPVADHAPAAPVVHDIDSAAHRVECARCRKRWKAV